MKIEIKLNATELREFAKSQISNVSEAAFPNTTMALQNSQKQVQNAWKDWLAGKTSLPNIQNLEKTNIAMIQSVETIKNKDFDYSVYSDNKQLEKALEGTPAVIYDMKKTHPYGVRSRVSANNVPYLIIPFRWGTPNAKGTKRRWNNVIPQKDYRVSVLPMEVSSKTNKTHIEKNAKGEDISRSEYNWGNRITLDNAWDDNSVGMVRMKDGSKKSTYFTFRIISAKSDPNKWWYRKEGVPGVDLMGALKREFESQINEAVRQGFLEDIKSRLYKNN